MSTKYVALLRGINVGGKNKVSMLELRQCFESLGYENVSTYINSGNVLFASTKNAIELAKEIEDKLIAAFTFDSEIIKTLVISEAQLKKVVTAAPKGFGSHPDLYHSDVIFLIEDASKIAVKEFEVNPEVDAIWAGDRVIYYQRLSAQRTKSRLSKIVGKPIYKSMTIRNWNTVKKLHAKMGGE